MHPVSCLLTLWSTQKIFHAVFVLPYFLQVVIDSGINLFNVPCKLCTSTLSLGMSTSYSQHAIAGKNSRLEIHNNYNKKAVLPQGNRAMPQVFFSVEVRQQHSLQV